MDERGLFAGDVPLRDFGDPHRHPVVALGQRRGDARQHRAARVHAQHGFGGADRVRGELQAVQDQVRGQREQRRVLLAQRIAFTPVRDDDRAPRPGRAQLHRGRETAAAAAAQAGRLDGFDQPVAAVVAVVGDPGDNAVAAPVTGQVEPVRGQGGHRVPPSGESLRVSVSACLPAAR